VAVGVAAAGILASRGAALSRRDIYWQHDVAYLARELPLVHVDGLTGTSRSAWDAAASRLESEVPALSNGQVIVGMARMVAMLRDDETQLTMPPSPVYPFAAQWIGGQLYLVDVPSADRKLLGARLVAVDGHPTSLVLAQLRREIDYQDPGLARAWEADYLNDAHLLNWLGMTRSQVKASFTLDLVGGHERTLSLTAIDTNRQHPRIVHVPVPLYAEHQNVPYWMRTLTAQRAVYLKYNDCLDNDGFQRLVAQALRVLRRHPAYRLIIDLRDNGGGDSQPFQALINDIRADPALNRPGKVIGLINGLTDSSAREDAYSLGHQTKALLIGQQVADPIDEYGDDGNLLRLPRTMASRSPTPRPW
jgi:hypothetical protein